VIDPERLPALLEEALAAARSGREKSEQDLFEELRIPGISTTPDRAVDVRRNADWLRERLEGLGMAVEVTDVPGGTHPVLEANWHGRPGAQTLTIYGHYDVQPVDPIELWSSPPFEPTVRDGFVFARGCADNKGNHMAAVKAVEHLFAAGGPPLNIRFLLEGEEEISGPALPAYLEANAARLASDYTLVWDGGFSTGNRPNIVTGLRGMLYTELEARGPAIDLHSGIYGGVAPNPLNTLARVLGELKDREGRVTVPGFYDDVAKPDPSEMARLERPDGVAAALAGEMGVAELEGEAGFDPVERTGVRPTLDVNGMIGGFTGEGMKTVIPAVGRAKVSMRLVPGQDPDAIFEAFRRHVHALSTPGVQVTARRLASARPVLLPWNNRLSRAAAAAFESAYGMTAVLSREGGSIPVTTAFYDHVGGEILVSGVIQNNARAHSPDENLSLDHYQRGIEMLIHLVVNLARGDSLR
jgi:acetylornithine deacetylase/succinyl-diaminopimelate desuccinylase-like protein